MATRTIVTSQPDVECDVCERRLLRGEQPDVFLARRPAAHGLRAVRAARRPRGLAARARAERLPSSAPLRPRRGRGLFERLRQARAPGATQSRARADERSATRRSTPSSRAYDCLTAIRRRSAGRAGDRAGDLRRRRLAERRRRATRARCSCTALEVVQRQRVPPARGGRRALARRARGERARRRSTSTSSIVIVVAWELCWYRYEVDLDDEPGAQARASRRAPSLQSSSARSALANAVADERGALALTGRR